MVIYLDKEYRCHTVNDGTMLAADTDFFDGKCSTYIEGYRYIPVGHSWTNVKGITFTGEMVTPVKNYAILESIQKFYEENSAIQADTDAMLVDYEYRLTMLELGIAA